MKVLFLDDELWRWEAFNKIFPQPVWVKTAEETIEKLKTEEYDILSLDHDLGTNSNGMDVVNYIIENNKRYKYIWIHSWNSPAASKMHEGIYRANAADYLIRDIFNKENAVKFFVNISSIEFQNYK